MGRAIVFSSDRANYPGLTYQGVDSDLYVLPAVGGCPLRLTDSSESVDAAAVSPTGAAPAAVFHASCTDRAGYDNNTVRPQIDTDETAAARHYPFPVFYLGEMFHRIMLTDVETFRASDPIEGSYRSPFFAYDRCAAGPGCGPEIQLQLEPICKDGDLRHLFPYGPPSIIRRQRGALVLIYHASDENQAWIYLGTLGIQIRGSDSEIKTAVAALRRFGKQNPSPARLPAPRVPASMLRLINRLERTYRHTHNINATAAQLNLDPSRVRAALKIDSLLHTETTNPSHC